MPIKTTRPSHIAVVGGGFTGMACAFRLLRAGYQVSILESQSNIGGLTSTQDFGEFSWDRFYHCILTSDKSLLTLLHDLGLNDQLRWTKTEVGLYSNGALHKMTSPADLLRYRHLSLASKLRLAVMTFYVTRIKNGLALESAPLSKWTRHLFGKNVYEQIWDPLFRCKLGELRRYASAAFLWGTLVRLASTRKRGPGQQEQLGYVHGGYDVVFRKLQQAVASLEGSTHTGVKIRRISCSASGSSEGSIRISTCHKDLVFDGAILTVPNKVVASLLDTDDSAYKDRLAQVMYLGIICVVLVLKRRLSPFYVTNVTEKIGFTGIIEMTNLIDPETETNGRHLVYLPRYTSPNDPLFEVDDETIWQHVWTDLSRMHPDLSQSDIENRFVFRERTVQPVPTIGYSEIAPPTRTPVAGIYVANTAQIVNNTLNNNAMASIAEATCMDLMRDIAVQQPAHPSSQEAMENLLSPVLTR
jgi:protoporphyrinogen oxidase